MSTVTFRYDYAKFMITCEPEVWNHLHRVLHETSHQMQFHGEWLKSHKVNRLYVQQGGTAETWTIDIWGEWSGIIEQLPPNWARWLKRVDVRAIVWDASEETILDVGQHMQRNVTSHNIHVFNSRKASKRLGRDRGGVGFAIGSHKSDLRITCYKRTGEPVAQEFQCSGAMLKRLAEECYEQDQFFTGAYSLWAALKGKVEKQGNTRLQRVLESSGIGTYWPVIGAFGVPALPPTQAAFIAELGSIVDDMDLGAPPFIE